MKTTVIIKKNRDFTRMYRRAKTKTGPLLVTYCARNRLGHNRIGITASKRVGDAVRRNRAKRVIRAAYTGLEQQLPQGYDFIFVARSRTAHCKMQPVQQAMLQQITALTAAPSAVAIPKKNMQRAIDPAHQVLPEVHLPPYSSQMPIFPHLLLLRGHGAAALWPYPGEPADPVPCGTVPALWPPGVRSGAPALFPAPLCRRRAGKAAGGAPFPAPCR